MDSINYAKTIQDAMLPKQSSLNIIFNDSFVYYQSKETVSGDFYFTKQLGRFCIIVVADCTGHGVPGAFMSMLGMSLLNEIVRKADITKASEVLDLLREYIKSSLNQLDADSYKKDGMDISLMIINTETLTAQYAGAFNPMILIKHNNKSQIVELEADKMPIGFYLKEHPFTNHEILLEKNDTIYLFTDGYKDQFGLEDGHKLKSKAFYDIILEIQGKSMIEQAEILHNKHKEWKGDNKQTDDVLVMGIKI